MGINGFNDSKKKKKKGKKVLEINLFQLGINLEIIKQKKTKEKKD